MTTLDAFKAALYTALWTFIALFGTSLLGWLDAVAEWATSDGATVSFPDGAVLVKAGLSAAAAALSGIVAFAVRQAQVLLRLGTGPTYGAEPHPPTDTP